MTAPDIGRLDLSDSDSDDLFASPSRPSKSQQKPTSKPSENSNAPQQRSGESKYDAEQARDAALQKELESVRSINEVIEGVVSSLETAKGNMDVRSLPDYRSLAHLLTMTDCISHRIIGIYIAQYLDPYPFTNGAQSAADSKPQLARRKSRLS